MSTVIYPPGHFTHCIDRNDYEPLPEPVPGAIVSGPATYGKKTCDYLLGGKLVCMLPDPVCVIGTIVGREPVLYGKSGEDAIDNDFSFNLLLAPYRPEDFRRYAQPDVNRWVIRNDVAKHAPQGELIVDRTNLLAGLVPRDPEPESPVDGYGVLWHYPDDLGKPTQASDPEENRQNNLNKLRPVREDGGVSIPLPVLHCECEGSRIWMVCNAMRPFLDVLSGKPPGAPGPSVTEQCHKALGWIPIIGDLVCGVVETIIDVAMFPLVIAMAAAAAAAWAAAQMYDDLFITGPVAERLALDGRMVVVQGNWTWDSGHAGHLELHPVSAIAVAVGVPEGSDPVGPVDSTLAARVTDLKDRWCHLFNEAPPPVAPSGAAVPRVPPLTLTTEQAATASNQQQPENQWSIHPAIDGCSRRRGGGDDIR